MYRRRQALALIIVLVPLAIVGKALLRHHPAATPTRAVSSSLAALPTNSSTAKPVKSTPATAPSLAAAAARSTTKAPSPSPTTADCRKSALTVTVTTDAQTYAIGSPVTLAMRISNTGGTACRRDVGALPNELWVTDASGLVVWSSDACQTAAKPQVVVMPARSVFGNSQVWNGTNSGRDCTAAAADATAGTYFAHARNDTVQAQAYAFTIN